MWSVFTHRSEGRTGLVRWLVLAVCLGMAAPVLGAVSGVGRPLGILLQLEGIAGESNLPEHEGWMAVERFDTALRAVVAGPFAAGRAGAGLPVAPESVACWKRLDKASPKLAEAVCKGQAIPQARIEFYTISEADRVVRFYQVHLEDVLVSSYSLAGDDLPERPLERVALDFQRVEWTYTEFSVEGRPLADHRTFWDFVSNEGGYERIRRGFKVSAGTEIGRNGIRLRWISEAGRKYRILRSDLLNGEFTQVLPDVESAGDQEQELWVPREGPFGFFIITEVDDGGLP